MPSDKFPGSPERPEYSIEELEKLIKVKLGPGEHLGGFLFAIRNKEMDTWRRFVLTPDLDLVLTEDHHTDLSLRLGIKLGDCLIKHGAFEVTPDKKILFVDWEGARHSVRKVAEKKIIEFFKANRIEVTNLFPTK